MSTSPKNLIKVTGQLHLKNSINVTEGNFHKVNLKSYLTRSSLNEI